MDDTPDRAGQLAKLLADAIDAENQQRYRDHTWPLHRTEMPKVIVPLIREALAELERDLRDMMDAAIDQEISRLHGVRGIED